MQINKFYKHIKCTDMVVKPIEVFDCGDNDVQVSMLYYSLDNNHKPHLVSNVFETHTLSKEALKYWKEYIVD